MSGRGKSFLGTTGIFPGQAVGTFPFSCTTHLGSLRRL